MAVDRHDVHRRASKQPTGLQEDQAKVETGWRTITRGRDRGTFPRPRLGRANAREETPFLEGEFLQMGSPALILVAQVNGKNPHLSQ